MLSVVGLFKWVIKYGGDSMSDIDLNGQPGKWEKINQLNTYYRTLERSETKTLSNPIRSVEDEFGSRKRFGENYSNRCKSENVNQIVCNSDEIRPLNSKYNDGNINIRTERKGRRLNELVIRGVVALSEISRMKSLNTLAALEDKELRVPTAISRKTPDTSSDVTTNKHLKENTTNPPNSGPLKKDVRYKLNGTIIFIIGSLLNYSTCTAATTEQPEKMLGSSVQLSWLFTTEESKTVPIIQFQNHPDSFKELEGGKYERILTRNDGQTKITLIVNNITDTDYGVYRCYLNNQTDKYKDINFSLADFTWMSTTRKPVSSTFRQDVELYWEYKTKKSINKIILSRKHQITNHAIDIGIWTIGKGFKQNRVDVSTELVLTKKTINDGGGERISLELQQTVEDDFDKIYYCHVFDDDQISYSQGVELVAERSTCAGTGIQYDNNILTFTWVYRYRYPIAATLISRIDSAGKEDDVGFWYQNKFESYQLFKDRVVFNITEQADGRREITLVLINTTASDYNTTYICEVIPADGQLCLCRLELVDVDDLNHDNYTSITGVTKPRDKILSSTNSTPIIVVAVINPLLVVILILTTIFVVRKRRNRRKASTPLECNEKESCNSSSDSGNCSIKEKIS